MYYFLLSSNFLSSYFLTADDMHMHLIKNTNLQPPEKIIAEKDNSWIANYTENWKWIRTKNMTQSSIFFETIMYITKNQKLAM